MGTRSAAAGQVMGHQLALFAPEPAPAPRTGPCTDHDARHVCDRCPERYDTDCKGFVHHSLRKGRVALRHCRCGRLVTFDHWIVHEHIDQCDWCKPKPFPACEQAVCKPACCRHRVCPRDIDRDSARFRAQLRRRQVVGPLDEMSGKWAMRLERWDPWGTEAQTGERDE